MYLQNLLSTQKELTGMGVWGGVFLLYSPGPSASLLPLLASLPGYAVGTTCGSPTMDPLVALITLLLLISLPLIPPLPLSIPGQLIVFI